ncbi:porin [Sedimentitalea nanhaiensis]|uniref:Outer membrane protein OmpU n=1 Tax=Sedimentitalea nanhaiensis TaxID=999627 RepID=A0A1I7BYV0_9RHOB|nr:porin [Sedimentitalea nanhaiensis]SFT92347.1 outer membrane protein OmpU [Sedimentitalea nanhaiensis]
MKKVLFATTALIALGSMAAADVRLSGYGRFGLDFNQANDSDYNNGNNPNYNGVSETNITSRLRLQVDMSTETDGGVGFNARFRAQAESRDGSAGGAVFNGARFGVTYGGLIVNVGNIIGAVENAPGLYTTGTRSAGTGIDGMDFMSLPIKGINVDPTSSNFLTPGTTFGWDAYSSTSAGANGVEALYTVGGFTGHVSFSQDNDYGPGVTGEDRLAIMLTYSFGDYYVTGAYQSVDNNPLVYTDVNGRAYDQEDGMYFLAAGADWGQFGAKLAYGSNDVADSWTLEGNMDIGAASNLLAWVNSTDVDGALLDANNESIVGFANAVGQVDGTAFGINYQYDLGGGSTFVAGYAQSAADSNNSQFQAGVYFSF